MVWVYAFGLVFLIFAIVAVGDGDPSPLLLAGRIVLVVGIAVGYLVTAWIADCSLRARWLYLSGYVGLLILSYPAWGWTLVGYGVYVAIMLATLLPWRQSRIAIVVWALLLALTIPFGGAETATYIALISVGMGLATAAAMEAGRVQGRLQHAQRRVDTLSVAAERERIGRDLHDILGHSLTAISIKADLAARLVEVDPAAAKIQIVEIEQVSRQALADVRTTASGMREVRLATEIASARSVLLAAGIESRMPSALPPMSAAVNELFGWVVREGVTNVVRHSRATVCTVIVEPSAVEVRDDGRGSPTTSRAGSGLRGLRTRIEAGGGVLRVEAAPSGGTVLRAELAAAPGAPTEPATERVGDIAVTTS
ncbi:MAG: sensor histidine kinase [Microlunatus sp.]|nr:sensor histidine kinase [Microlunatus sp.]MDN5769459.1 sensor histidine kinase [Microlunatus sp.]